MLTAKTIAAFRLYASLNKARAEQALINFVDKKVHSISDVKQLAAFCGLTVRF